MLKIIKGNLWELVPSKCVIVHGCNAQGVMGSGFAKDVKIMYPKAYNYYVQAFKTTERLAGKDWLGRVIAVDENGHTIVNAITQEFYGRDPTVKYVSYAAVVASLTKAAKIARKLNVPIYMPLIGGGLANGNRDVLMALFEEIFETTEAYLVIND